MASVIYDEKSQRMAEEMVMAEARHVAQREAQDCDCKDGMFPRSPASRRKFLFAAGSAASGGYPQCNCLGPVGKLAWSGDERVKPRSQTSLAISADGDEWRRLNASPDLRQQIIS